MATKKEKVGEEQRDLWKTELVIPIRLKDYAEQIENTEKIIVFGESNTGKTRWYMKIPEILKKEGMKPEDILMCVIFSDRPTGITKLINMIPKEYVNSVLLFPINNYEELVSSTSLAEKKLEEHKKKTGKIGWLVVELLAEQWVFAQDYYTRQAYGEGLANYFAEKKQLSKAIREDSSAYKALEGWKDWSVIKFYHNFNWIDKIKRMPFNVLFTSEAKEEENKDSIFGDLGFRPSGEKSNLHRVDTILYLSHKGNKFTQECYKLTGYSKIYSTIDITNKNGYEVHKQLLKRLEDSGLRTSKIEDIEKEAGIDFNEEKTITTTSKGKDGQPKEEKISKKELTKNKDETSNGLPPDEATTKDDSKEEKNKKTSPKTEEDEWAL